jgi:hypothetical protein
MTSARVAELVEKIRQLETSPPCTLYEPGSLEKLAGVESKCGLSLPADYKQLMLHTNGIGIYGFRTVMHLEPVEVLVGHNMTEEFHEYLPGMFVIGDDAGGDIYYYDPNNKLGYGIFALFLVPMGAMRFTRSVFVAKSIVEAIEQILDGVYFFNRPYLKISDE